MRFPSLNQPLPGPCHVLAALRRPGDAQLLRQQFLHRPAVAIHELNHSVPVLAFLRRQHPFGSAPRPQLLLLDLDLPGTDPLAVLEAVKDTDELRSIPVLMLTHQERPDDVRRAYDGYANALLCCASTPDRMPELVCTAARFWLQVAQLPPV